MNEDFNYRTKFSICSKLIVVWKRLCMVLFRLGSEFKRRAVAHILKKLVEV